MVIMIDKGLIVQFSGFTLAPFFWRKGGKQRSSCERRASTRLDGQSWLFQRLQRGVELAPVGVALFVGGEVGGVGIDALGDFDAGRAGFV